MLLIMVYMHICCNLVTPLLHTYGAIATHCFQDPNGIPKCHRCWENHRTIGAKFEPLLGV